jgi:hypothetical protein
MRLGTSIASLLLPKVFAGNKVIPIKLPGRGLNHIDIKERRSAARKTHKDPADPQITLAIFHARGLNNPLSPPTSAR